MDPEILTKHKEPASIHVLLTYRHIKSGLPARQNRETSYLQRNVRTTSQLLNYIKNMSGLTLLL